MQVAARPPARPADPAAPYRMSPFEAAAGWVFGHDPVPARPRRPTLPSEVRAALDAAVLPALLRPPCVVAFSGGRDSSAVLAVATRLAAREGLPPPAALSYVFPPGSAADERGWQETVVRHLGVADWERIPVDDDLDVVGPLAASVLTEHGPVFPPAAHTRDLVNARARGGAVLTGEGGDEVLGSTRSWVLANVVARRGRVEPRAHALALRSLVPGRLRRRRLEAGARGDRPWLRPATAAEYARRSVAEEAAEPLDYRAATWRTRHRRAVRVGLHTLDLLAARHDVALVHPLLDLEVVGAYLGAVPRLGPVSRTAAMRLLFADLLPDEVLRRRDKAAFNAAAVHRHARAFAAAWDGSGVAPDLVDPERLRAEWLSPLPHAASLALLQQAWLAGPGRRPGR